MDDHFETKEIIEIAKIIQGTVTQMKGALESLYRVGLGDGVLNAQPMKIEFEFPEGAILYIQVNPTDLEEMEPFYEFHTPQWDDEKEDLVRMPELDGKGYADLVKDILNYYTTMKLARLATQIQEGKDLEDIQF